MIVSVTSKEGDRLYTKVQANPVSFKSTQDQLRAVARGRTTVELLQDEYFATPECADAHVYGVFTLEDAPSATYVRAA